MKLCLGIVRADLAAREKNPMRVLIVDDDESSCQLLTKILKRIATQVDWTTDSQAGFAQALQHRYDLLVLDVQMPGLLGTDFAALIKQEHPQLPIILISAFADEQLYKFASRLGVSLLSKPFLPSALLEATTQMLGQNA
jgi:DNA-binding response OmpR family regulator